MHQQPASDAFEVVGLRGARKAYRQHPHAGFGGKDPSCFGVELRRDHHLDELLGYRCSGRGIEAMVEGHDAPECRRGVGGKGALVRLAE